MGEVFRDMAAIVPELAIAHATPGGHDVATWLKVTRQGDKKILREKFSNALPVAASQNIDTLNKLTTILGSPLREALVEWVKFGYVSLALRSLYPLTRNLRFSVGLELFQVHGIYEMIMSQCYEFWAAWLLSKPTTFYKQVMSDVPTRYFDVDLQEELSRLSPRNLESIDTLFWPRKGAECPVCPIQGQKRNTAILRYVSYEEYLSIYRRLQQPGFLEYPLLTKTVWTDFIKHNVTAVHCVVQQVQWWLLPAGESITKRVGRFTDKSDVKDIIEEDYLQGNQATSSVCLPS